MIFEFIYNIPKIFRRITCVCGYSSDICYYNEIIGNFISAFTPRGMQLHDAYTYPEAFTDDTDFIVFLGRLMRADRPAGLTGERNYLACRIATDNREIIFGRRL